MGRPCTVCHHPDRDEIDRDLAAGVPNRRISAHRAISEQALRRHKAEHLPAHLLKAAEVKTVASADSLLNQVRTLQEQTLRILQQAGDQRTALAAIAQARGNLQLLAQLLGELAAQPNTTVNILVSPHWITVRTALMVALAPFPGARIAVAAQLLTLENGDARGR